MKTLLETAKTTFSQLSQNDKLLFQEWIMDQLIHSHAHLPPNQHPSDTSLIHDDAQLIEDIITTLRLSIQSNGMAPAEKVFIPDTNEFEGYTEQNTQNVDSFLLDDCAVDQLCDEGKLFRSICLDCNSTRIQDISTCPSPLHLSCSSIFKRMMVLFIFLSRLADFISHSMSSPQLRVVFHKYLPLDLSSSTILDVGSRLGAVLYGVSVF
eukprot:Sdes_comp20741_c0_seq1m16603